MFKERSGRGEIHSGCDWSFTNANIHLNPESFLNIPSDFNKLPDAMVRLVSGTSKIIKPGWSLESLLIRRAGNDHRIVLVCTNPARAMLNETQPSVYDFIIENALQESKDRHGVVELKDDIVSALLTDTNYVGDALVDYNELNLEKRGGIFRKTKRYVRYQSGVAYVEFSMSAIDDEIRSLGGFRSLGEYMENPNVIMHFRSLLDELKTRKAVNPLKLFPD